MNTEFLTLLDHSRLKLKDGESWKGLPKDKVQEALKSWPSSILRAKA